MMDPDSRPLAGRVILLMRPASRGADLADRLRALGGVVVQRPTIRLAPPTDPAPARRAVTEIAAYDWLACTSPTGVECFAALYREIHGDARPIRARIAAIGTGTAKALTDADFAPAVVARESRSEGLAAELAGHLRPGERILVVRPEVARPVLVEALSGLGARVEAVAFYRNAGAPGIEALIHEVCAGRFAVAVLTSPSTLERLLEAAGPAREALVEALSSVQLVAIGEVTAAAVLAAGLRPSAVAVEPSPAGIVGAVVSLVR